MATCLNRNTPEYQRGLKLSGISEFEYNAFASDFVEKYNRFPELDEIPHANSRPKLEENLGIHKNFTSSKKILDFTGKESIPEAQIELNRQHKDLKVDVIQLDESSIIDVKNRPNQWEYVDNGITYNSDKVSDGLNSNIMAKITNDLSTHYGINFKLTNTEEIATGELKNIPDAATSNAFIYNGDIYINADTARVDAPIHEIMHLLVGSIKFSDPRLYSEVTSMAEQLPNYEKLARLYPNRGKSDVNEEIFISEFAKHVSGEKSILDNINPAISQKIFYNVYRVLDSALFGGTSVKNIDSNQLFNHSLVDLSKMVSSDLVTNKFSGSLNLEDASLHRILENNKADLMRSKKLTEVCE